ncbi:hypothetical protein TTHERM_01353120 (macronuclear) [Tetrahymena thermophila SB210]|uniref:Uncharacterized protein n=1 Tax=Tetrahymena thermophila (strain SB210) TaxID=312017 RepID=Q23KN5_TETTS|nr:hypothetical protein TTHERM_01353120 [Tetrahymena thermophila SB210]EAR97084.1 hypothetical protein TTHERM_01353120 [Tetrahymena thermophila SB210]|eukprot:XP_001017329.1 hypothetical protein TTHERM_01353120 [Tetrahymena thermophila SB210]
MLNEKGVSNQKEMRSFSDKLDNAMGWKDGYKETSGTRGFIHGAYHTGVGVAKFVVGNTQGAKAELNRAGTQFSKMIG